MILLVLLLLSPPQDSRPVFREQTIETDSGGTGYNSCVMDVNGDGRPDIVLVTQKKDQVIWYENPTWKKHVLLKDPVLLPEPLAPFEPGGKAAPGLFVGGNFILTNTVDPCPLWLLKRPEDPAGAWPAVKIDEEPSLHRLTWISIGGRKELVVACLMGRGTAAPDWSGPGAPLYLLRPSGDPFKDPWTREGISSNLHRLHGIAAVDAWDEEGNPALLAAAFEGIHVYKKSPEGWKVAEVIGKPPGASEIRIFRLPGGKRALAAIEPWHGDQVTVYVREPEGWQRKIVLEGYRVGHGIVPVDFSGHGEHSLVVGFRGGKGQGGQAVLILHPLDGKGERWETQLVDTKEMEADAIHAVDLRGNGRIDIVATGKGSNVKIYWNEGNGK